MMPSNRLRFRPRPRGPRQSLLLAVGALLATGCATDPAPLRPTPNPGPIAVCPPAVCTDTLAIRYIGSGGFLIRYGGDAVLTGGMVSNPGLWRLFAGLWGAPVRPDGARVDSVYDALGSLGDVRAVLVGHSHYDHLMEVPAIAWRLPPGTPIFGDATMANLIGGMLPKRGPRPEAIPDTAFATVRKPGVWYDRRSVPAMGNVRILALVSDHAPNVKIGPFRYTIANARQKTPPPSPPYTAYDWKQGQTLAYLIDFLVPGTDSVAFRVHFSDAAARPPFAFPPDPLPHGRKVDVLIVCEGNFRNVASYPDSLIARLRPEAVIVGHWEDFFRPRTGHMHGIPLDDQRAFVRRMNTAAAGIPWIVPTPMATVRVARARGG
jgi:hypothetical protein